MVLVVPPAIPPISVCKTQLAKGGPGGGASADTTMSRAKLRRASAFRKAASDFRCRDAGRRSSELRQSLALVVVRRSGFVSEVGVWVAQVAEHGHACGYGAVHDPGVRVIGRERLAVL